MSTTIKHFSSRTSDCQTVALSMLDLCVSDICNARIVPFSEASMGRTDRG